MARKVYKQSVVSDGVKRGLALGRLKEGGQIMKVQEKEMRGVGWGGTTTSGRRKRRRGDENPSI